MGIEKVLPAFSDLDVFLQLLPRSATGERMNPYSSMWTRVHDGDGRREFHLVLLGNGRTNVLADPRDPTDAGVHPLLGVPERLPRLRTHRRPRRRLGVLRPDRRGAHPQLVGVGVEVAVCGQRLIVTQLRIQLARQRLLADGVDVRLAWNPAARRGADAPCVPGYRRRSPPAVRSTRTGVSGRNPAETVVMEV